MKRLCVLLYVFAAIAGCRSVSPPLVDADAETIFAVAKRELEVKCPDFDAAAFLPRDVSWHCWGPCDGSRIYVTFFSKEVTNVKVWSTNFTDGSVKTAYDHKTATVALSNQGELIEQNRSEWIDFPDMQKVWYSESTVVTTNSEYLSAGGYEVGDAIHVNTGPVEVAPTLEEQYAKRKLQTVVIPELDLRSTPPHEALAALWAYLPRELAPEGKSSFTWGDIRFPPDASVTFTAREISLYEALLIICELSALELHYNGFAPRLRARRDAQQSPSAYSSKAADGLTENAEE